MIGTECFATKPQCRLTLWRRIRHMISSVPVVTAVKVLGHYRLRLTFKDGLVGDVDLSDLNERAGVFEPLKDPAFFSQVYVDSEMGTIAWPNGPDLDPCGLYESVVATTPHPQSATG